MTKILITSGPTRQFIDPVRYLSNASSGTMGKCLAEAALGLGFEVLIVSGPVHVEYPAKAEIVNVISTDEMLSACMNCLPGCDGVIGAAAPCDYQPVDVADHKIRKTGEPFEIKLIETTDIMAAIGSLKKPPQWTVGFALETADARFRAIAKMQKKSCDLVVLNGVSAIDSTENSIEIIAANGETVASTEGLKSDVARVILKVIQERLVR